MTGDRKCIQGAPEKAAKCRTKCLAPYDRGHKRRIHGYREPGDQLYAGQLGLIERSFNRSEVLWLWGVYSVSHVSVIRMVSEE